MEGGGYRVSCPQAILEQLREWARRAVQLGIAPQVLEDIRTIQQRLATDPLGWGDPQYRLEHLRLLMCHRFSTIFYIRYGIDEDNRVVYVAEVRPRRGHPLAEDT